MPFGNFFGSRIRLALVVADRDPHAESGGQFGDGQFGGNSVAIRLVAENRNLLSEKWHERFPS